MVNTSTSSITAYPHLDDADADSNMMHMFPAKLRSHKDEQAV